MSAQAKKKVILIGAGLRGQTYTNLMAKEHGDTFEVVAVAEPLEGRRNYIKNKHGIPDEMCFESWEPMLEKERFADVAIISTQDRYHFAPAMAAIEKGYNLLLEKPIAPTPEECDAIVKAAHAKGVFVLVCHVLRFTDFFIALKQIIDSGEIGRVMNIHHTEGVGNVHQSHSFVRGNWAQTEKSAMMLLAKSCHDMDILAWLIGKKCKKVQSFGALSFFKEENAPEGAPERCIDGCPHGDTCPYNSVNLYLKSNSRWFRCSSTMLINPTDADVEHALRTTDYGRCAFRCKNDVVDHQIVNMEFEDDVCVSFTMSAFNLGGRTIRIMGTKGEIQAKMGGNEIIVYDLETKKSRIHDPSAKVGDETIVSGHGGGDSGIIRALADLFKGNKWDSVCDIAESSHNHMIAFAAESSRLAGGALVNLDEYVSLVGDKQ